MYTFWSTALSLFTMLIYIVPIILKYGIPKSISASYYLLKHHIFFTLAMWISGGLLIPGFINVSKMHTQWIGFLIVAGTFLVGAAPRFEDNKHQRLIHETGATIAIIASFIWCALNFPIVLVLWSLFIIYGLFILIFRKKIKKAVPIFVIEIIAMSTLYITIFTKLLKT